MSVLDTLKAATPSRRTVTICLDGALQAEWETLLDQAQDVATADAKNIGSLAKSATADLADRLDAVRERMLASQVTFVFQQMPWSDRIALQAAHPPRKDNLADRINIFNIETFYPALIKASCVEVSSADGGVETEVPDEVWAGLLGSEGAPGALNMGQFNSLVQTAKQVNEGETTVPPSARSLLGNRDSGASLAQPSPGQDPAPSASGDGNPPTSPSTSTTPRTRKKPATTPPLPESSEGP